MKYTDDSYATMLLTMALSPDREEYARPFNVLEFRRIEAAVRDSELRRVGKLLNLDLSGLMIYLGLSEEEAYRAYTLLNRSMQLTYALDGFMRDGIEVVTCCDAEYPRRLTRALQNAAPPFFYRAGDAALLDRPGVAVLGISGVKTGPDVRGAIGRLAKGAAGRGWALIAGGELGVSRVAESAAVETGGALVEVLGGGMREHVRRDGIAEKIALGEACVLSLEHPDAMFTVSHAIGRSKLLFTLANAAFIFNTDGRRGETEALQNRYCDRVYAWTGCPENRPLIAKGAIPLEDLDALDFEALSQSWKDVDSEQLNIFDLL